MSKAALILVGLVAATGIGLAVSHADAAPKPPRKPTQDDPDADDGEVIIIPDSPPTPQEPSPAPGPPAGGTGPGSGTATPNHPISERRDLLPPELREIDLSGQEKYTFQGLGVAAGRAWNVWTIEDGLNGMDMIIYVSNDSPQNWISLFIKEDPPPSEPPFHYIIHKVSNTRDKAPDAPHMLYTDWMIELLALQGP